jgi:DNA-binding NarL/FixJ family response regulator
MTIRVFIADDHQVLRDGMAALIQAQPDMTLVGGAEDGEGAVEGCRAKQPDVAVIDLSMPGIGGLAAIPLIRSHSATRILVLTMHDEPLYLRAALDAGASGYLIKRSAGRELVAAIREVHRGSGNVQVKVSEQTMRGALHTDRAETSHKAPHDSLSKREFQVLELLSLGYTNKEIAVELALATKSVDTYRQRLQDKLGLKGRALLVRYALDHGILKANSRGTNDAPPTPGVRIMPEKLG